MKLTITAITFISATLLNACGTSEYEKVKFNTGEREVLTSAMEHRRGNDELLSQFKNCSQAKSEGYINMNVTPYSKLDRDGDGIACEK